MSAPDGDQDNGTPGEPAGAPGPRRSRLGCSVRALLALFLAGVLSLALALALLDSAAGGATARLLLERWASTAAGGPVRIDTLDLQPWRGGATATAVSLRLEGVSLDVERIDASWSPGSGASVRLERPVVVVQDTGEPEPEETRATGLAAQPWRVLETLGRAEVIEGKLEMRDVTGAPWLVLGRVDAETRPGSRRGADGGDARALEPDSHPPAAARGRVRAGVQHCSPGGGRARVAEGQDDRGRCHDPGSQRGDEIVGAA